MTHRPIVRTFAGVAAALMFGTAQAEPVTVDNCGTPLTFDTTPERVVVHDSNRSGPGGSWASTGSFTGN